VATLSPLCCTTLNYLAQVARAERGVTFPPLGTALPPGYLEDRHAGNDGVGIVLGRRVDRVVRPDDQRQVAVVEVVVDLLHLQH
jgi:hypothetical protein